MEEAKELLRKFLKGRVKLSSLTILRKPSPFEGEGPKTKQARDQSLRAVTLINMYQNHLEGLLNHKWLVPIFKVCNQ